MANVIFKRPVRVGKVIYQASKRSVEIDDKALESSFMKALIGSGDIAVIAQTAQKAAIAAKAAK